MTVSGHYLTQDFVLRGECLDFFPLTGAYNSDNLSEHITVSLLFNE